MDWYTIKLNKSGFELDVKPASKQSWQASVAWDSIERVCYELGDFLMSDTIYIFVKGREHSFMIPSEAQGGAELWGALIERKLFDANLAINIMSADVGTMHCWPALE